MRRFITLTLAVLCLALQPMKAQKSEATDNFKYHKAVEILDEGGGPVGSCKLAGENIKENTKHIINQAMKDNSEKSGFFEAVLLR